MQNAKCKKRAVALGLTFLHFAFCTLLSKAATLEAVGALGNSSESGATLVRVAPGIEATESGVYCDRNDTLWLGGGDVINHVGIGGQLLERRPLEPAGSAVNSTTFAVLNGTLYFLGRAPKIGAVLFALPLRGADVAKPLDIKLPPRARDYVGYRLAPQPFENKLLLACEAVLEPANTLQIFTIEPQTGAVQTLFTVPGQNPESLNWDAASGVLRVGGRVLKTPDGWTNGIAFLDARGAAKAAEVAPVLQLPATPSSFLGRLSPAAGAWWDAGATYGFIGRLDDAARGVPGTIARWEHIFDVPAQFVAVPHAHNDLLALSTTEGVAYLLQWDDASRQLLPLRRFGALPVISSVGLSASGWATVGTAFSQLWWRWDDEASAPPRMADMSVATTPGAFFDDEFFALGGIYNVKDVEKSAPTALLFAPRRADRNCAARTNFGEPVTPQLPRGLALQIAPGAARGTLLVTDAKTRHLWRTAFAVREHQPDAIAWQPVTLDAPLAAPSSVAALPDGRLLLADAGRILLLEAQGETFKTAWQWRGPDESPFGAEIEFALDGARLLVADTQRHRVLLCDWEKRQIAAQWGQTDQPGSDAAHCDRPTHVSLSGPRSIVADNGNQRVVKLILRD